MVLQDECFIGCSVELPVVVENEEPDNEGGCSGDLWLLVCIAAALVV